MKYCPNCRAEVTAEMKHCRKCGLDLTQYPNPSTSSTDQTPKLTRTRSIYWWLIIGLVVIVGGWLGYSRVYVPKVTKAALSTTQFTAKQGYQVTVNPQQRRIVIGLGSQASQQIQQELVKTGYGTNKIAVEKQLAKLAKLVNKQTVGDWQITIATPTGVLWKYKGNQMVYRLQTSNTGKQLRQQYQLLKNRQTTPVISSAPTMIPVVNVLSQVP